MNGMREEKCDLSLSVEATHHQLHTSQQTNARFLCVAETGNGAARRVHAARIETTFCIYRLWLRRHVAVDSTQSRADKCHARGSIGA